MTANTSEDPIARRVDELERRLAACVDTRKLVLRNARGEAVVEIAATPDTGEPELVLSDGRGRDRVLLRLVDAECHLEFVDEQGRLAVRLACGEAGTRLALWGGPDAGRRVELRIAPDGAATLAMLDPDGAVRTVIGVSERSEPVLSLQAPHAPTVLARSESDAG